MKVYVQQPVVPAYRAPLFRALSEDDELELEVHASRSIPGCPESVALDGITHRWHEVRSFLGGRISWQRGMVIPDSFGHGDVLVINSNPRFLQLARLVAQARRKGVKVIAWNHARSSSSGRISGVVRRLLSEWSADLLLLYTDTEAANYSLFQSLGPTVVRSLNNTLDPAPVESACRYWSGGNQSECIEDLIAQMRAMPPPSLREFQASHGITPDSTLLFCGRLQPKAQLEVLLRAMPLMRNSPSLVVIGAGGEEEKLRALAHRLEVSNRVHWVGQQHDERVVGAWFLSSAVFVYPGSIGLSLNHAMLYGLPVVAHSSRMDHMPEADYLNPDCNGSVFTRGNPVSLASVLDKILSNPNQRISLARGALQTAWQDTPFGAMVERFSQALRDAVNDAT